MITAVYQSLWCTVACRATRSPVALCFFVIPRTREIPCHLQHRSKKMYITTPSLSLSHSPTHSLTHSFTHLPTHSLTFTHSHSLSPTLTPSLTLPLSLSLSLTHSTPRSKKAGPVNGDECYFWRTTGCAFGDQCRYLHLPESAGVDAGSEYADDPSQ